MTWDKNPLKTKIVPIGRQVGKGNTPVWMLFVDMRFIAKVINPIRCLV